MSARFSYNQSYSIKYKLQELKDERRRYQRLKSVANQLFCFQKSIRYLIIGFEEDYYIIFGRLDFHISISVQKKLHIYFEIHFQTATNLLLLPNL